MQPSIMTTSDVRVGGSVVSVGTKNDPYARVQGRPDLIKDQATGAVLNTDQQGLAAYRARRSHHRAQEQLAERVSNLERKLDLILAAITTQRENKP
jgi:hypothetical protein